MNKKIIKIITFSMLCILCVSLVACNATSVNAVEPKETGSYMGDVYTSIDDKEYPKLEIVIRDSAARIIVYKDNVNNKLIYVKSNVGATDTISVVDVIKYIPK